MASDVVVRPARWMADALRAREVGAVELLEAHVVRVEERNPAVNALVLERFDEARREAGAADTALARGEPAGPLHGLPFTVKDPVAVTGLRSPSGSRLFAERKDDDAEVVRRRRRAGAIAIGKTNVSELCLWWDSVNPLFGATRNPARRVAHGRRLVRRRSRGARQRDVVARDRHRPRGSIRNPCHFVGVCGLKLGRGAAPFPRHHPLPHGAANPAGRLGRPHGTVRRRPRAGAGVARAGAAGGRRRSHLAAWEEDGLQPVAADCREAVRRAARALVDAGYEVVDEAPPHPAEVRAAFDTILEEELAAVLPGVVAGREDELAPYLAETVTSLRGRTTSFAAYLDAAGRLADLEVAVSRWLEGRIGLFPCAPETAPPLGGSWSAEIDGVPLRPGGKPTLATYANALGLAAACVPVLRSVAGLPVGVRLIGRPGGRTDAARGGAHDRGRAGRLDSPARGAGVARALHGPDARPSARSRRGSGRVRIRPWSRRPATRAAATSTSPTRSPAKDRSTWSSSPATSPTSSSRGVCRRSRRRSSCSGRSAG